MGNYIGNYFIFKQEEIKSKCRNNRINKTLDNLNLGTIYHCSFVLIHLFC